MAKLLLSIEIDDSCAKEIVDELNGGEKNGWFELDGKISIDGSFLEINTD